MSHGLDAVEALRAALPDAVVALFALVTQLGDTWLLFLLIVSLYLLEDRVPALGQGIGRRDAAFLLALGLGGAALTAILKALFVHPRPVGYDTATAPALLPAVLRTVYVSAATASGYSFPSGHAVGSTVVYGGIALASGVSTWRRRLLGAVGVVTLIILSRIVLGVHFLGDVLAGVAVGVIFLAAMQWLARGEPEEGFLVVVGLALLGLVIRGVGFETLLVLGAAVGARITWEGVGAGVPDHHDDEETVFLAAVGIPLVAVMFAVTYAFEFIVPGEFAPLVSGFLGGGVTLGVLVALPVLARRYIRGRAA